jgi:hypothetical protein
MKRILKIFFSIVAILIGILMLILVLGYNALISTINVADYAAYSDLPAYNWARVDLSDDAVCSEGSDYHIYTRRGESNNLLIHFAGGGACWDGTTCSQPIMITHFTGYYFPFIWEIIRATLNGIFQRDNPDNPFRDWNIVYVPYCTADFHIGNTTRTYTLDNGESITIHHAGRQNVTEALDWVYANFDAPEKLLISGESAGAWGSIFWTPTISAHYPTSDIYQLADGAYIETPRWHEFVDDVWQADFENNFGFEVGDDIVADAYLHYSETSAPNVTYLHINTLYDAVIPYFQSQMNGVTDLAGYTEIWSQGVRVSMARIANSNLNYEYYLTDYGRIEETGTTPHTSISGELFYKVEEGDTTLHDWLRRIVIDGERFSVGEEFLYP